MKKILLFAALGIVFLAANGGVTLLVAQHAIKSMPLAAAASADAAAAEPEPPKNVEYLELAPEFIVNFDDEPSTRFMQLNLTAVLDDTDAVEALEKHMPAVRNDLLFLFSSQDRDLLLTREGKEDLRMKTLASIQEVMTANYGTAGVSNVYFTRFVMQ